MKKMPKIKMKAHKPKKNVRIVLNSYRTLSKDVPNWVIYMTEKLNGLSLKDISEKYNISIDKIKYSLYHSVKDNAPSVYNIIRSMEDADWKER